MATSNSKARQRHTNEELQRASLAVQYELVTMATTHELLQELGANWGSSTRDKTQSNALLHAFLLSARSLLSFLYAYSPRPSDIIAEDFFDDPDDWRKRRLVPDAAMANGELLGQISKRLAHLTWDHATPTKLLWGPFRIAWNIGLAMQCFLQLVAEDRVHHQLREDVALVMMRLEALAGPWGGISAAMPNQPFWVNGEDGSMATLSWAYPNSILDTTRRSGGIVPPVLQGPMNADLRFR